MVNKKKLHIILIISSVIFLSVEAAGYYLGTRDAGFNNTGDLPRENDKTSITALQAKNSALKQRLKGRTPHEIYIVVDTGRNILYLKRGNKKILEATISSGSGSILKDPSGDRQWTFDTPRGEHHVKTKYVAPAWIRPDWAFIEEGEEIPKDPRKRVEESVLGAYGLGFGNGYFIHGTLYTRLLGRNVTHGCIRVGDEDLKHLYHTAGIGTRIYIF